MLEVKIDAAEGLDQLERDVDAILGLDASYGRARRGAWIAAGTLALAATAGAIMLLDRPSPRSAAIAAPGTHVAQRDADLPLAQIPHEAPSVAASARVAPVPDHAVDTRIAAITTARRGARAAPAIAAASVSRRIAPTGRTDPAAGGVDTRPSLAAAIPASSIGSEPTLPPAQFAQADVPAPSTDPAAPPARMHDDTVATPARRRESLDVIRLLRRQ